MTATLSPWSWISRWSSSWRWGALSSPGASRSSHTLTRSFSKSSRVPTPPSTRSVIGESLRSGAVDLLIGDVFRNAARAVPERTAAVFGARSITFGEIDRTANRMARAVQEYGVGHGDRVAVWAATDLDVVPLFAALAKLGAVFAPMNAALSAEEAVETAFAARPGMLVVDEERADAGAVAAKVGAPLMPMTRLLAAATSESDDDIDEPALAEGDPHVIF